MYITPKTIVVDFLRSKITDPRSRISTKSESFTALASQTSFSLTPSTGKHLSHIIKVEVNSTEKKKWRDYYIDFKNEEIVFYEGLNHDDVVNVEYGEGSTNWIYPDKPNLKLNAQSFPRISVSVISSVGDRLGNYEAPVASSVRFQVDIWTKEKQDNQIFTIDNHKYTGEDLAEYLAYQVTQAFEENENALYPAVFGYDPVNMPIDLPFDTEMQCHHKKIEFILFGLNIGRVS